MIHGKKPASLLRYSQSYAKSSPYLLYEPQKIPCYLPLCWLFYRNPYDLVVCHNSHITELNSIIPDRTLKKPRSFHCSYQLVKDFWSIFRHLWCFPKVCQRFTWRIIRGIETCSWLVTPIYNQLSHTFSPRHNKICLLVWILYVTNVQA